MSLRKEHYIDLKVLRRNLIKSIITNQDEKTIDNNFQQIVSFLGEGQKEIDEFTKRYEGNLPDESPFLIWDERDENGETILTTAVRHKKYDVVIKILEKTPFVDQPNIKGETPLDIALEAYDTKMIGILTERKAVKFNRKKLYETMTNWNSEMLSGLWIDFFKKNNIDLSVPADEKSLMRYALEKNNLAFVINLHKSGILTKQDQAYLITYCEKSILERYKLSLWQDNPHWSELIFLLKIPMHPVISAFINANQFKTLWLVSEFKKNTSGDGEGQINFEFMKRLGTQVGDMIAFIIKNKCDIKIHPLILSYIEKGYPLNSLLNISKFTIINNEITFLFKNKISNHELNKFLEDIKILGFDANIKDAENQTAQNKAQDDADCLELLSRYGAKFTAEEIMKKIANYSGSVDSAWINFIIQQKFPLHTIDPSTGNNFLLIAMRDIGDANRVLDAYEKEPEEKGLWDYTNHQGASALDIIFLKRDTEGAIAVAERLLNKGAKKFNASVLLTSNIFGSLRNINWLKLFNEHQLLSDDLKDKLMQRAISDENKVVIEQLHKHKIVSFSLRFFTSNPNIEMTNLFLALNQANYDDSLNKLRGFSYALGLIHIFEYNNRVGFRFDINSKYFDYFLKIVKEHKRDITLKDSTGKTLKDYAIEKFDINAMRLFIANGMTFTKDEIIQTITFAKLPDYLDILSENKISLDNCYDAKKIDTLLTYAAKEGNIKHIEELLRNKANVSLKNNDGHSAIYCAAAKQNLPMISLLLMHGATSSLEEKINIRNIILEMKSPSETDLEHIIPTLGNIYCKKIKKNDFCKKVSHKGLAVCIRELGLLPEQKSRGSFSTISRLMYSQKTLNPGTESKNEISQIDPPSRQQSASVLTDETDTLLTKKKSNYSFTRFSPFKHESQVQESMRYRRNKR